MKLLGRVFLGIALDGGVLLSGAWGQVLSGVQAEAHPGTGGAYVRGVTVSCQTSGREWGKAGFGRELEELQVLGCNWVAIHPYAWIGGDGEVRHRLELERPPRWLTNPIEQTRARGMSLLVKPHLGYWGSPFAWRGAITFEGQALERFWESYTDWLLMLSEIVSEAEAFCVGTELDLLLEDERPWRELITGVRARTDAHLTYAANWDSYSRVGFWDALDTIGLQAYFPISDENDPDASELERGWSRVLEPLRSLHRRTGKPIVFTELGYNRSLDAARAPWSDRVAPPEDLERAAVLQARCLRVALATIEREREWLRGAFLWKWFVGEPGRNDRSFLVDTPHMRGAIESVW